MVFYNCVRYFVFTGILGFILGRLLPKGMFNYEHFPYKSLAFEKNGKFYEKFKIRKWQSRVPDMSKILPRLMPAKNLKGDYRENLPRMIEETCVAEFIHFLLSITGLYCLELYPGKGGFIILILYIAFFNMPFIMIQRYNRPRLIRLYERLSRQHEYEEGGVSAPCEC